MSEGHVLFTYKVLWCRTKSEFVYYLTWGSKGKCRKDCCIWEKEDPKAL